MNTIDLNNEAVFGRLEWAIIIIAVSAAGYYLWRKLLSKKHRGCSGCGGRCGNKTQNSTLHYFPCKSKDKTRL